MWRRRSRAQLTRTFVGGPDLPKLLCMPSFVFNRLDKKSLQTIDFEWLMAIHFSRKDLALHILVQPAIALNFFSLWLKIRGIIGLAGISAQNPAFQ
jgi:hypothetical protein